MMKELIFGRGEIVRRLRLVDWRIDLEFKPQDLWIGVFWKTTGHCLDAWICLLPCVPLHLCVLWTDPEQ